jgi:hypothetical protein
MSKTTTYANSMLRLILNGTAIANLADNAAASPLTNLHLSLHTTDPGEAGTQSASEVAYPGYARLAVSRSPAGFTVTGDTANLAAAATFGAATGGSTTAAFFGVGSAASGAGTLFYRGPITPNIPISNGTTPQLSTATSIKEE